MSIHIQYTFDFVRQLTQQVFYSRPAYLSMCVCVCLCLCVCAEARRKCLKQGRRKHRNTMTSPLHAHLRKHISNRQTRRVRSMHLSLSHRHTQTHTRQIWVTHCGPLPSFHSFSLCDHSFPDLFLLLGSGLFILPTFS